MIISEVTVEGLFSLRFARLIRRGGLREVCLIDYMIKTELFDFGEIIFAYS